MNYKYALKLLEKQRVCQRKIIPIRIVHHYTRGREKTEKEEKRRKGKIEGRKIRRKEQSGAGREGERGRKMVVRN